MCVVSWRKFRCGECAMGEMVVRGSEGEEIDVDDKLIWRKGEIRGRWN